ncbi:MAG: hypothetical protein Kow001_07730 [Acidobacteriota bacterium]
MPVAAETATCTWADTEVPVDWMLEKETPVDGMSTTWFIPSRLAPVMVIEPDSPWRIAEGFTLWIKGSPGGWTIWSAVERWIR